MIMVSWRINVNLDVWVGVDNMNWLFVVYIFVNWWVGSWDFEFLKGFFYIFIWGRGWGGNVSKVNVCCN